MKLNRSRVVRFVLLISLMASLTLLSSRLQADTGSCGGITITLPFTDVMGNPFFCQIAAAYFSGLTNGTTATTYSPSVVVTREQMAAFTTRTLDQSLKRGNRRAALKQWATPPMVTPFGFGAINVGNLPQLVECDGADLWVANFSSGTVTRVHASDGDLLRTWTGATNATGVLVSHGLIWITGFTNPGKLYLIGPNAAITSVQPKADVGALPLGIASDGSGIWTANNSGSVSIVPLSGPVTTVSAGFSAPVGVLYDGSHIWVTDEGDDMLKRLNSNGSVALSIPVGANPRFPVFDGTNIWVPNFSSNSVTVVRVKDASGNPLASPFELTTLTGNGLNTPVTAAFDGQRILVTNELGKGVSLWKAMDLTPVGFFPAYHDSAVFGACSDGVNFWLTLRDVNVLARF
jgi:hypothetical protein